MRTVSVEEADGEPREIGVVVTENGDLEAPFHQESVGDEVKALWIGSVPMVWSTEMVQAFAEVCGDVAHVEHRGHRAAILFHGAITLPQDGIAASRLAVGDEIAGLDRWKSEYASERHDPVSLQKTVDEFMSVFDRHCAQEDAAHRTDPTPDEDGFVTVRQKKKRKRVIPTYKKEVAPVATHVNFYRQSHKKKRESQLHDLQHKFQLDKDRLKAMKESRRFNPFVFE